ncbi:MAG: hypothetical protein RLZZ283_742 [Candidatus Parcubacteria bacterium]|jgi:mutator protein MutT
MVEGVGGIGESDESLEKIVVPSVQVVLVRNGEKGREVFLGHRIAGGFQNQWSFPGGKIDPGESPERAACREAEEETGISIGETSLQKHAQLNSETIREKDGRRVKYVYVIHVFIVQADNLSPKNASPDEHDEMRWVSLSDALAMDKKAVQDGQKAGVTDLDKIPNALAPRTRETIAALAKAK